MPKFRVVCAVVVCTFPALSALAVEAFGQGFPYSAPRAPEFDYRGNHVASSPIEPGVPSTAPAGPTRGTVGSSSKMQPASVSAAPVPPMAPEVGYSERPRVQMPAQVPPKPTGPQKAPMPPKTAQAIVRTAQPPAPPSAAPPGTVPAASAPPPQGGPGQPQMIKDCSHYVKLIANSRSEAEMRAMAREFLTCLMQIGWSAEDARKHVIATIESTYRVMKQ